jgi:hypothetical protein
MVEEELAAIAELRKEDLVQVAMQEERDRKEVEEYHQMVEREWREEELRRELSGYADY